MNDSHPSGMPHVGGTLGLGQQVPAVMTVMPVKDSTGLTEVVDQLKRLVDIVSDAIDAMPAHTHTLVSTLPARKDIYAFKRRKSPLRVEAFALWSTGAVTPIVWDKDDSSIGIISPEEVDTDGWEVGDYSAYGDPDA